MECIIPASVTAHARQGTGGLERSSGSRGPFSPCGEILADDEPVMEEG